MITEVISLMKYTYGNALGLSEDCISQIYKEGGITQNNYQYITSILYNIPHFGSIKNNVLKVIIQFYEQIVGQMILSQQHTDKTLQNIQNNWYYKFGQSTKAQKIKAILFFFPKKILKKGVALVKQN